MAKKGGNPQNLRPPFKPGQSGNPSGRPKIPPDILQARKFTQLELERVINALLYLTKADLQARIKDPATPMIEMIAASIMAQAAVKGDHQRLEFILARMIGRVQERIEVSTPTPFVLKRRNGEEIVMGVSDGNGPSLGGLIGAEVRDTDGSKTPSK